MRLRVRAVTQPRCARDIAICRSGVGLGCGGNGLKGGGTSGSAGGREGWRGEGRKEGLREKGLG